MRARAKGGVVTRRRHKKILKLAKGYWGRKSKIFRPANQQVMKSLMYAYRDRRVRKREFRKLWITRINAAARQNGLSYSRFVRACARRASRSTARSWPTWRSETARRFNRLVALAKENQ